jgi:inner membrane protein
MASLGHVAVGMAAAQVYRRGQATRWPLGASMALWSALSLLPDADVLGFRLGVAYSDPFGHRGATHSLAFAALVGAALALGAVRWRLPVARTALAGALVVASHPLLDTLTNGGLGCALLWPFDDTRHFAPWTPIPVAPIGRRFLSPRGLDVALTELALFAPLFLYALWPRRASRPR